MNVPLADRRLVVELLLSGDGGRQLARASSPLPVE
jgi:hypothetical protein